MSTSSTYSTASLKRVELNEWVLRSQCLKLIYDLKINVILNKNEGFMTLKQICNEIKEEINESYLQRVLRYTTCFDLIEEKTENDIFSFKTTDTL